LEKEKKSPCVLSENVVCQATEFAQHPEDEGLNEQQQKVLDDGFVAYLSAPNNDEHRGGGEY
jgi:hypothetical protein